MNTPALRLRGNPSSDEGRAERVAYHEAAHAVAEHWLAKSTVKKVQVGSEPMCVATRGLVPPVIEAKCYYAGVAAELVLATVLGGNIETDNVQTGSGQDMPRGDALIPSARGRKKAFKETLTFVVQHWPEVESIARALLKSSVLSGDRVRAIIRRHPQA